MHEELAKAAQEREAAAAAAADEGEGNDAADNRRNSTHHKDAHRHAGKTRGGKDNHVNIPRRGAV